MASAVIAFVEGRSRLVPVLAQRRLGTTDLFVPPVGLGTAPLGGWPSAVPAEQAIATIRRAWEHGFRYFDTAPFYGYGFSEENLGHVLPPLPRSDYVLSTKVGKLLVEGDPGRDRLYFGTPLRRPVVDFSYTAAMRSLEESRARLGVDHVDVALIHDPDDRRDEALRGAYRALVELRRAGELAAIGVGMNWSRPLAEFIKVGEFDCMLCAGRYTLLEQAALDDLLPAAEERQVSIVAGGIYNSGLLIEPKEGATYNYAPAPPGVLRRAEALETQCREFEVPLRAAALQFPLAHPAIAVVIVGARSPEEVDDTRAMLDCRIPPELWDALREKGLIRADAPVPGGPGSMSPTYGDSDKVS